RAAATATCRRAVDAATTPAATPASTPAVFRRDTARRVGAFRARARPTHRAVILTISVDPIRRLIVDGDVIHLSDWKRNGLEGFAMVHGKARPKVVRQPEVIRVLRIDPDVVVITAPRHFLEVLAAIGRAEKAAVRDEDLVRI